MATVTGLTAQRMIAMEESTIIGGLVDGNGYLQLQTRGGTKVNAGLVKGKDATALLEVLQSDTATLTLTGAGTPTSPWKLRVDVKPTFDKLRLTGTGDASLSSTNHAFQIGPDNGGNIIIDGNEIMSRNNGGTDHLGLNWEGGNVGLGNSSSTIDIPGRLNRGDNTVLWSGAQYMQDGQTAPLSEKVSEQTTGIILCWSRYTAGAIQGHNKVYHTIPKHHQKTANGLGIQCPMYVGSIGSNDLRLTAKYVYVNDTSVIGNVDNNKGEANWFVLTAVLGF